MAEVNSDKNASMNLELQMMVLFCKLHSHWNAGNGKKWKMIFKKL